MLRAYQSSSSELPHWTLQPESPVPPDELEQTSLLLLQPASAASHSENSDKACKPSTLSISFSPFPLALLCCGSYQSSSSLLPHWTLQPESPPPPDELEQTPLLLLQPDSARSWSEKSVKACRPRTLSISISSLLNHVGTRRLGWGSAPSENQMHRLPEESNMVTSDSCLRTAKHARHSRGSDRCQTEARSLFKFDQDAKETNVPP